MTIYVDELIDYGVSYGHAGPEWCHMTTDGDKAELQAFAARLGLKRSYFQNRPAGWHYDLTRGMRAKALRLGAVEVAGRQWTPTLLAAHRAGRTVIDHQQQQQRQCGEPLATENERSGLW